MEHSTYLIIAYMAIWSGLSAYLFWLSGRQRQTARRLEILSNQLKRQENRS